MCRDIAHGGRRCGSTKEQSLARKRRRTKALLAKAEAGSPRADQLTERLLRVTEELNAERLINQRIREQEENAPRHDYAVPQHTNAGTHGAHEFGRQITTAVNPEDPRLEWDTIESLLVATSDGYRSKSREEMIATLFEVGFYNQETFGDVRTLAPITAIYKQDVASKLDKRLSESLSTEDLFAFYPDLARRRERGEDEQTLRLLGVSKLVDRWADGYSRNTDGSSTGELDDYQEAARILSNKGPEALTREPGETVQERVARAFTLAQYQETQEYFNSQGITHLTVHRGMSWGQVNTDDALDNLPDWAVPHPDEYYSQREVPLSGVSSFSVSKPAAEFFANHGGDASLGTVISGTVPVSRILSTPLTGVGSVAEREVLVLEGEGNWQVGSNYGDALSWEEIMERFWKNDEPEAEAETEADDSSRQAAVK